MPPERRETARLPLQTGSGALRHVLFVTLLLPWSAFVLPLIAVAVCLGRAWGLRASDVVLTRDGLRVEGGPHDGVASGWRDVVAEECRVDADAEVPTLERFFLAVRDRSDLVLAESEHPDERASMRELCALVSANARAAQSTSPPPPRAVRAEALACSACGAPSAPIDASVTVCLFCGADVAVPDALRARIRAAATSDAATRSMSAAVSALMKQPTPRRANASIALVAILVFSVLPAAVVAVTTRLSPLVVVVFIALAAAAFAAAIAPIANRHAWRDVAMRAAARDPVRDGAPFQCSGCAAPLPAAAPGIVVVRCLYCESANVLGLDHGLVVAVAPIAAHDLESILESRRRRIRTGFTQVGILVLIALASAAFANR